jgi:hypothetical protein
VGATVLVTIVIGDRPVRADQTFAFDDVRGDALGEQLGLRDRAGLIALDLLLNLRDHRGFERTTAIYNLISRLGFEGLHALVIVVGDLPAQRLGLGSHRGDPQWILKSDAATWIAIPSALPNTLFWRDSKRRRETLAKLAIALDNTEEGTRLAVAQVMLDLKIADRELDPDNALGIDDRFPDPKLLRALVYRHTLAEKFLFLNSFGWSPGDPLPTIEPRSEL